MERTLILIKPDAVQRGLAGAIISRFEQRGLTIVALKGMRVTAELAREHYKEHAGKGFFQSLIDFITGCPIVAMVLEGPDAIEVARATIGATNPVAAAPGSIRGDFGLSVGRNLVHGSDSAESAEREVALFFKPQELHSYQRSIDPWVIEK